MSKKFGILVAFFLFALGVNAQQHNNVNKDGVIIDGYDPVAFFTEKQPIKGSDKYSFEYDGAKYLFSSKENLALFKADPEKYKVQFGGWCAYAVAQGSKAPIKIETWDIYEGKLYFNYNKAIQKKFNKRKSGYFSVATQNWPEIKNQ